MIKLRQYIQATRKWLTPGMGVKRWLALLAGGITLLSVGFSCLFRQLYPVPGVFHYLTLQFVSPVWRAVGFGLMGAAVVVFALVRLNQTLLAPFTGNNTRQVVSAVYRHRRRGRGPKVVAIGGGHGLSVLLRGIKQHTSNVTAIVTVADDGGSSGRLRRELGVLPPGDFRNCIAALADDEALITQLFQYRFGEGNGLNGHSFGNLFITAMLEVTGSFERAILESGRVLAIQGRVVPSTLLDVTLMADLRAEWDSVSRVTGESSIVQADGAIERVYLEPDNAPAFPDAVRALLDADMIVAGPGSLFTSVLPNLLVPDVARAVAASRALKVYICNVATQRGETDGYSVKEHIAALEAHVGAGLFHVVLVNDNQDVVLDSSVGVSLVRNDLPAETDYRVISTDLVDPLHPWRHDSDKLARELMRLVEEP